MQIEDLLFNALRERMLMSAGMFLVIEISFAVPLGVLLCKAGFSEAVQRFWLGIFSICPISLVIIYLLGGERAMNMPEFSVIPSAAFWFGAHGCLIFLALVPWPVRKRLNTRKP